LPIFDCQLPIGNFEKRDEIGRHALIGDESAIGNRKLKMI